MIEATDRPLFRRISIHVGELSPTGRYGFEYLSEGAANVIFVVRFRDGEEESSNLMAFDQTCVLRMHKDLPFAQSTQRAVNEFETKIAPIFGFDPSLLLPPATVRLTSELVTSMNAELERLEQSNERPGMRHGVYLPAFDREPCAVLLRNLFPIPGRVVEFKPKWLAQSPSAPRNSQRCRTCALNASRRQQGHAKGKGDSGFCPFDLLSSNIEILTRALRPLWPDEQTLSDFVKAFGAKIQPKLRELQRLQREYNDLGINSYENPEGRDFSVALALRDCSFFVKASASIDDPGSRSTGDGRNDHDGCITINAVKIIDLDLKDAGGGKLAKWADMERSLIEDGWYTDTSKGKDVHCAMSFQ